MNYTPKEAEAILADPDGHYPYKKDAAVVGHPNEKFGVAGDPSAHVSDWVVMPEEAEATERYVESQAEALRNPSHEADAEVKRLGQELQDVRDRVRAARRATPGGFVWGNMIVTRPEGV